VPATACVDWVPLTAPPEVLTYKLLQHLRVLPELGRHFHDDVVLLRAEGIVDRGHLRLGEGIAQGVVDLAFGESEARGVSRSTIRSASRPPGCRSVSTSVTSGVSCNAAQLLRPGAQLGEIVAQQACTDIANWPSGRRRRRYPARPAGTRDARHPVEFRAQAGDDLSAEIALLRGFRVTLTLGVAPPPPPGPKPPPPTEPVTVATAGSCLDDGRDLLQLGLHELERGEGVAANAALQLARCPAAA
jgi:hypothetical protein